MVHVVFMCKLQRHLQVLLKRVEIPTSGESGILEGASMAASVVSEGL